MLIGEIYIENLRIGNYSLIEQETNRWYNLTEDTDVVVKWNETQDTTIENELMKGQIKIIKIDLDNKEVKLPGVKFELYNQNHELLETLITDENGTAITNRYAIRDFDKLYLKETETLENYVLNDEEKEIVLEANQITTMTFENEKKKGEIEVIKVDKDNNEVKLEGVIFEVFNSNGDIVDTLVTDSKGKAKSIRLPIDDEYIIYEKSNPDEKYVLNDKPVKVILEQDEITTITFENEVRKGQIEIIKIDADNEEVKLEGVTFEILDSRGNVVDTIITDKEGKGISKRLSIYEELYTVREKSTLKEYVLSEETQKVVLEEDEITSLTFENEMIKGNIKIIKLSNGKNEKLNIEDKSPLKGAKFVLSKLDGEVIGTYETDESGIIEITDIPYGEYLVSEYEAPTGFLKDTETQKISITEKGQVIELTFTNSPIIEKLPKTGSDINMYLNITFSLLVAFLITKNKIF